MRAIVAWSILTILMAGCAAERGAPVSTPPTGERPAAWQQQMDEARRLAAEGSNYILVLKPREAGTGQQSGVYVFYNNPSPFCYTYMLPGEWVAAEEANAYRSPDGRAFAGVMFVLAGDLRGLAGATLVQRMASAITREDEKALGQPLAGVELAPFASSRAGTWKWSAAPVTRGNRRIALPAKIIVDLSPEAVAQITIAGTADDDELARRVIASLRTTADSECYWPVLERMLKSALGDR